MKEQIIYSDNPINDIWLSLETYSYSNNINKYLNSKSLSMTQELSDSISGAILQASEYFKASTHVTIQTAPILLYYGSINLLFACSALMTGNIPQIKGHGLNLIKDQIVKDELLLSTIVVHNKKSDGFSYYYKTLKNQTLDTQEEWTIQECLSAIPELTMQFINQFNAERSHIIPLDKIITDEETAFRTNSKIINVEDIKSLLVNDVTFNTNYFPIQTNNQGNAIFRKRLNGQVLAQRSYTGQYYLPVSFNKKGQDSKTYYGLFSAYIALFGLCTLCRYYPQFWTPYVRLDPSGDVNYIKLFLSYVQRYIPNIILDYIENSKHIYSGSLIVPLDKTNQLSQSSIESVVEKILEKRR